MAESIEVTEVTGWTKLDYLSSSICGVYLLYYLLRPRLAVGIDSLAPQVCQPQGVYSYPVKDIIDLNNLLDKSVTVCDCTAVNLYLSVCVYFA